MNFSEKFQLLFSKYSWTKVAEVSDRATVAKVWDL